MQELLLPTEALPLGSLSVFPEVKANVFTPIPFPGTQEEVGEI